MIQSPFVTRPPLSSRQFLWFQPSAASFLSKDTGQRSLEAFVGWKDWGSRRNEIVENVRDCHYIQATIRDAHGQANRQSFVVNCQRVELLIQQIPRDTEYLCAIEEKEAEFTGEERILAWLSNEKIILNLKYTLDKPENSLIKR